MPSSRARCARACAPSTRRREVLTSPADGAVSQLGAIEDGRIFQAKGHWFSAAELLADAADARQFENGSFATIYLSPRDYHRVHMPLAGGCARCATCRGSCSR